MNETLSDDGRSARSYTCPPWCCGHTDDPDEFEREGRIRHFDAVGADMLWQLANPVSGVMRRDETASYDVSIAEVEQYDGHRLGEFVHLDVNAPGVFAPHERTPVEVRLTAGEARSLAAILVRAADRLELWR